MQIVAALFVENINFRQVAGPATRIDITGAYFSTPAPEFPFRHEPHLVVLVRCPPSHSGSGILECTFVRDDGEQVGFNRQEFTIEPGKFGYRLVRVELVFDEPGTIEARCRIAGEAADADHDGDGGGCAITVPLTVIAG